MLKRTNHTQRFWLLVPVAGTIVFIGLYVVATFFYPGGSQLDKNAKGFSWTQNYWCNLLNKTAINGQPNAAQPIAATGMIVLCVLLAVFWYCFPQQAPIAKNNRLLIQIPGVLAMLTALLLFSNYHDPVINVATLLGLVAIVGTFVALKKLMWNALFYAGLFTIGLVVLNNILYYGSGLLIYLPVVQKITFLYMLLWICAVSLKAFVASKTPHVPSGAHL